MITVFPARSCTTSNLCKLTTTTDRKSLFLKNPLRHPCIKELDCLISTFSQFPSCTIQAFIQDFTAGGGVGRVKGHVSLEMFWKCPTNGKDLGITKAT